MSPSDKDRLRFDAASALRDAARVIECAADIECGVLRETLYVRALVRARDAIGIVDSIRVRASEGGAP